jgi:hypothetical protein
MAENSNEGLVSGPPHQPDAPTAATPPAEAGEAAESGDPSCDHDWTVVNRDENRLIHKCARCGATRRE